MPTMPRMPGRAKKIAAQILGKPLNAEKKSERDSRIERKLLFEETSRVR